MTEPLPIPYGPRLEVILDCKDGDCAFLLARAREEPDAFFVALAGRSDTLRPARAQARTLENLLLPDVDLDQAELGELLLGSPVQRFHLHFPAPGWPGEKRLVELATLLGPRGEIFVQTAERELALELAGRLAVLPQLEPASADGFVAENPFRARSDRERACLAAGRPVFRLLFWRADDGGGEDEGD